MPFPIDEQPIGLTDAELTDQLGTLYEEGSTLRELAARHETSEETIRRLLIGAGIPRRTIRTPYQILQCLRELDASLDRPIQRTDLQPPMPSYRAVARAFGSWQLGVLLALGERARPPKR